MMKKLFSLLVGLVPVSAFATIPLNPDVNGNIVVTTPGGLDATAESYEVTGGNSLETTNGGITLPNDLIVGAGAPSSTSVGSLYINIPSGSPTPTPFSIASAGAIQVDGILNVLAGRSLSIGGSGAAVNAGFGTITSAAGLNVYNIAAFTSGNITASNTSSNLTISANTIDAGAIEISGGNANIASTGLLDMLSYKNLGSGDVTIDAGSIESGVIQNNSGTTTIDVTGNITTTNFGALNDGSVENSGTQMEITAADMTVAGTMKNDSNNGTMILHLDNWTVNGGTIGGTSFANAGNFIADVTGHTFIKYGFNLGNMDITNVFSLETGTLGFDPTANNNEWLQLFANKLNSFELIINDGSIVVQEIINGTDGVVDNDNANMFVKALSITGTFVQNIATGVNGKMEIRTHELADGGSSIHFTGIESAVGSNTEIAAATTLTVDETVANSGTMVLDGEQGVTIKSVANDGNLEILSTTNAGKIKINENVASSAGTVKIESREIDIDGVLRTTGGITTVIASDAAGTAVQIGSIEALGGRTDITALLGLNVDNGITVSKTAFPGGGALNFTSSTRNVTAGGTINIAGDLTASSAVATGNGNVNIAATGVPAFSMKSTGVGVNNRITIGGNVIATQSGDSRTVKLDATTIDVTGNVTASNATSGNTNNLTFGDALATNLTVGGALTSGTGGVIDLDVDDVDVGTMSGNGGKIIARGTQITATSAADDAINLQNGIWFDGTNPNVGLVVTETTDLTLNTTGTGGDIRVLGGMGIGTGNKLTLNSADQINAFGAVLVGGELDTLSTGATTFANMITNNGVLNVNASTVTLSGLQNTGTSTITSTGTMSTGSIDNSGTTTLTAASAITSGAVSSTAGLMNINGTAWNLAYLTVTGGAANLNTNLVNVTYDVLTSGDFVQGSTTGMLNLTKSGTTTFNANSLTIGGDFNATRYNGVYDIANAFDVTGDMIVTNLANVALSASTISADDVTNEGTMTLSADGIVFGDVTNSGTLDINSGTTTNLQVASLTTTGGGMRLIGKGLDSVGSINLSGRLLQNSSVALSGGDVNVLASNYTINAADITTGGINQTSGRMTLNTNDLTVLSGINATDLCIASVGSNWLTIDVAGNVSGNTDFIGVEKMTIGGSYVFNDNSQLLAAILPEAGTTYWATVSLADDNTLGQITNNLGGSAEALITVNGQFVSDLSLNNPNMYYGWDTGTAGALMDSQFGVNIFDVVDQGTAIWLVHADAGVTDLDNKVRNAVVRFCNANGSLCYNYLDSIGNGSTDPDDLPAYLSMRDTDGDGIADSIYLVFDPRFGGPVEIFKIQPIVKAEPDHTLGEYETAGALDELIAGQAKNKGFNNRLPIELVPLIFDDTIFDEMSDELYARMEQYQLDHNGAGLSRFSRLFQPRELEQLVGAVSLNEHTTFRDFEDRMFDEFIWNRNRNLKKAWVDVDFATFTQNGSDDKKIDGDRFSITGGFDWQDSETLILGLAARVSNTTSSNSDTMDLAYKAGPAIRGDVDVDVSDLNIGIGGYLMKTIDQEVRAYGNLFLDIHMLDVSRDQTFMGHIEGSGTSFSLITEWGVLHDWLNQYLVGNIYARAGYNFGFTVNEQVQGSDYMRLQQDGYLILTPGYSLTAQKRVYPSVWFQFRPNITLGVEYDVLGTPDIAQFKFAPANKMTDYHVDVDPLWAYAGAGIEFLHVSGVQVGIDYRYQYNSDIQMHKVKLSGIYRF